MKKLNCKGTVIYENYTSITDGLPFIFVHVPKTGGTSIRRALTMLGYETATCHQSVAAYEKTNGKTIFQKMKGYAVVRNPYDRIVSSYFFGKSRGSKWPEHRARAFRETSSFVEFCRFLQSDFDDAGKLLIIKRQVDYLCDSEGFIPVELGCTDYLDDFWDHINKTYFPQSRIRLKHHNKSAHPHWTDCHTRETRSIIDRIFPDDMEVYEEVRAEKMKRFESLDYVD